MKLEQIGFYTLSEQRVKCASATSPLSRCELVLGARCNFRCPYCRHVGGKDLEYEQAVYTVRAWAREGLRAIRFSGGEPTLWKGLVSLVALAKELGIQRIAISTNGSASKELYQQLIDAGVNDFSVSLDACCASDGDKMAGGIPGAWEIVVDNIAWLAKKVYTTVGCVVTDDNVGKLNETIKFADSLGVADIRVIPAAQNGDKLSEVVVDAALLDKYPILRYRVGNMKCGAPVRGLREGDPKRCGLVLDDMAVNQGQHFPCIIYMRESGPAIGKVGEWMREEREAWYKIHNTHEDPICRANCLDVCVEYNRQYERYHT